MSCHEVLGELGRAADFFRRGINFIFHILPSTFKRRIQEFLIWGCKLYSVCWNYFTIITSTPRQFSVIGHQIHSFSLVVCLILTGWENEVIGWVVLIWPKAGVSANAGQVRARLLCEQSHPLEGSRKKVQIRTGLVFSWAATSVTQVLFLKINQLIVICNPSMVRISVSKQFNSNVLFIYFFKVPVSKGGPTPWTLPLDSPLTWQTVGTHEGTSYTLKAHTKGVARSAHTSGQAKGQVPGTSLFNFNELT